MFNVLIFFACCVSLTGLLISIIERKELNALVFGLILIILVSARLVQPTSVTVDKKPINDIITSKNLEYKEELSERTKIWENRISYLIDNAKPQDRVAYYNDNDFEKIDWEAIKLVHKDNRSIKNITWNPEHVPGASGGPGDYFFHGNFNPNVSNVIKIEW